MKIKMKPLGFLLVALGVTMVVVAIATKPQYEATASQVFEPDYKAQIFGYARAGVKVAVDYGQEVRQVKVTTHGQSYILKGIRPQISPSGKFILLDEGTSFSVYEIDTHKPNWVKNIGRSWDHHWLKRADGDELNYRELPQIDNRVKSILFR